MGLILRRKDPLEEKMATPSSTLAWKIPWAEERGGLQSMGSQKSGIRLRTRAPDFPTTRSWGL